MSKKKYQVQMINLMINNSTTTFWSIEINNRSINYDVLSNSGDYLLECVHSC